MDYQRLYDELVRKAQSESRVKDKGETYYEAHHIIPKCMGGEGKTSQWRWHPNIVLLSAREHLIAHRLLCAIHPTNLQLRQALWAMANQRINGRTYRVSSRTYQTLRQEHTEWTKQRKKTRRELLAIGEASKDRGNKQVDQYTLQGVYLRTWKSIKSIQQELNINVVSNVRGRTAQASGFIWAYTGSDITTLVARVKEIQELRARNKKQIYQLTMKGEVVAIWSSIREASTTLSIGRAAIQSALRGCNKTAGGYVWKYL